MNTITEKIKNYFAENGQMITAGLLLLNGSVDAYGLYRSMR